MKTKPIILILFVALLMASCIKDYIGRANDKTNVCHSGKIINISDRALKAHLKHGDVALIDADGDGWVSFENECVPGGDCDDTDADVNPDVDEIP